MKIERLAPDVTAVGSPDRVEGAILGVILSWRFFGRFRPHLWSGSHFANLYSGFLTKIEWLVANVSVVGSLDRAERAILGLMLA